MGRIKTIAILTVLPFLITAIERLVITPAISTFSLSETSIGLVKYGAITLIILAISAFRGNNYGLEIPKKLKNILGFMFLALIAICYFFLFSIQCKGFLDSLIVIHLANWIITVFREEFILRGVIQTELGSVLKGSFLKISKSVWFTSIIFSVWHLVNLSVWPWQTVVLQMISCIPSGIILGVIKEKTGNTLLTYLLHICGDLLFFSVYLVIFGKFFFTLF
jgi:membrane protease YdiL (CAAX protease family)